MLLGIHLKYANEPLAGDRFCYLSNIDCCNKAGVVSICKGALVPEPRRNANAMMFGEKGDTGIMTFLRHHSKVSDMKGCVSVLLKYSCEYLALRALYHQNYAKPSLAH